MVAGTDHFPNTSGSDGTGAQLAFAGAFLYIHGGTWLKLADDPIYNGTFCLGILWFTILLNIAGLERAKWLQNVGAVATWMVGALVLGGGQARLWR